MGGRNWRVVTVECAELGLEVCYLRGWLGIAAIRGSSGEGDGTEGLEAYAGIRKPIVSRWAEISSSSECKSYGSSLLFLIFRQSLLCILSS